MVSLQRFWVTGNSGLGFHLNCGRSGRLRDAFVSFTFFSKSETPTPQNNLRMFMVPFNIYSQPVRREDRFRASGCHRGDLSSSRYKCRLQTQRLLSLVWTRCLAHREVCRSVSTPATGGDHKMLISSSAHLCGSSQLCPKWRRRAVRRCQSRSLSELIGSRRHAREIDACISVFSHLF